MNKILNFFNKYRLLDGYIGILGLVLHYRILANYSNWFHLFYISLRYVLSIDITYHPSPSKYPPLHIWINLFGRDVFNNGKKASQEISESVDRYMKNEREKKEAARKRIKDIDPEAARFI